ncbi:protein takeout [Anoplolepis gracilipes]|uniref:protein takeout n=1 Tax=Anoplolepis gracilipes TaxID=354296 RepID=UPI003B9E3C6C
MSFHALGLYFATVFVLVAAQDLELPVQTCKRDAADYTSCLRLAMQEAWPTFVAGVPKLELPPLDPYFLEHQHTVYETGDLRADITVKNVNIYGLAKCHFLAVRPHHSDDFFKLEVDLELPKMLIEGNFKANGAYGALQIGGEGTFNISLEDIKDTWNIQGPVANDRWTLEHFILTPEIGKIQVWFSDMFNGNEQLNAVALQFVNEYWPSLYREMLPFLSKNLDEYLTELGNRVLSKVSFSKTFP